MEDLIKKHRIFLLILVLELIYRKYSKQIQLCWNNIFWILRLINSKYPREKMWIITIIIINFRISHNNNSNNNFLIRWGDHRSHNNNNNNSLLFKNNRKYKINMTNKSNQLLVRTMIKTLAWKIKILSKLKKILDFLIR